MSSVYIVTSDEYHDKETLYAAYLDKEAAEKASVEVWPGSVVQEVPLAPETKPACIFHEVCVMLKDCTYSEVKKGRRDTGTRVYDNGSEPEYSVSVHDTHIWTTAETLAEANRLMDAELLKRPDKADFGL